MKERDIYIFPGFGSNGMTLREYYVGQALQGILSNRETSIRLETQTSLELLARRAIEIADKTLGKLSV